MSKSDQLSPHTASERGSASSVRSRRSHTKSRHGCVRCKQGRKKCDERRPQCSRCVDRNLPCEYARPAKVVRNLDSSPSPASSAWSQLQSLTIPSPNYAHSTVTLGSTSSVSPSLSPAPPSINVDVELLQANAQQTSTLDATELELLSHYLSHTARSLAFDSQDLYALQVGFPNLAFRSKPVMSSILALAAVCKCNDMIVQSGTRQPDQDQLQKLLTLADEHHRESLRQTQADIPYADHYDHIVANAPLMVLYASASRCVRIRLAQFSAQDDESCSDSGSTEWQWMSLIRAAHSAYTGLPSSKQGAESSTNWAENLPTPSFTHQSFATETALAEDGPSRQTRDLLLPIIAATSGNALEKLRARAHMIEPIADMASWEEMLNGDGILPQQTESWSNDIHACLMSLDVLSDIMNEVFHPNSETSPYSLPDSPPFGQVSGVSPWLRKYLSRVTYSSPSKPWRRTIMWFLNRVPAEYLSLVQTSLDLVPNGQIEPCLDPSLGMQEINSVSQLAIDIFAHWLVLVMLLDGVWWIGGIGAWELGRVMSCMGNQDWLGRFQEKKEDWWPKSMYNIATEIRKHV
ncbi:Zn(2)-C6 fungal-type domain-containing protein [Fusarium keratoplasticum]|nr:Zn(2)-C6 fungal-type domain-containing protein [Fusarium keratoplasticum]